MTNDSSFDSTRCQLCGTIEANQIIRLETPSMTSDARIVDLPLHKIACARCGLIRNGYDLTDAELRRHYEVDYRLAADAESSEPLIFRGRASITRSGAIAEWMINVLDRAQPNF